MISLQKVKVDLETKHQQHKPRISKENFLALKKISLSSLQSSCTKLQSVALS